MKRIMRNTILLDLGGTLVRYYERSEFPSILQQAIAEVQNYLRKEALLDVSSESIWRRVQEEDHEGKDHSVRPLEERLARIFQLDSSATSDELMMAMCRCFMKPIFALAHRYDDVLPVLRELRSRKFTIAIISNTPWGSPANLWREEIKRLGLDELVDVVVFCRDVGWRKPARQVFDYTLEKLQASAKDCIFVGDHPRWDLAGPKAVGIEAILIDRRGAMHSTEEKAIKNLYELLMLDA